MKNILFVLYHDFHSNSAIHVHHFANALIVQGLDCVIAIPNNKETASIHKNRQYKVTEFQEIQQIKQFFKNNSYPDVVHVWTPREIVRKYCQKLQTICQFKLFIHLEDNEEYILEKFLRLSYEEIRNNFKETIPDNLSHPIHYRQFLLMADGITLIMDKLEEFIPSYMPKLILWPGVDTHFFFPRVPDLAMKVSLGIPLNSLVLCYTGNVHLANIQEVRSLYVAVAMMNREGIPAVLVRTGQDFCPFLGNDDRWARKYSIELGYVDYEQIPHLLSLADVLIQPGKADKFNDYRFPSKIPEFMAMGKPIVLPKTNIGRFTKHLEEAIVLPIVDAANIISTLQGLLDKKDLYQQLSQGSTNFAQKHLNWAKNAEKLKVFYETVVDHSSEIHPQDTPNIY